MLAGDTSAQARPRAATVELIDGLIFGVAVISLLQGLCLLMRGATIDAATVTIARFLVVVVFPVMAL